ncbi:MAG: hypothetical protein RR325_05070 [Bacilli bacterium]
MSSIDVLLDTKLDLQLRNKYIYLLSLTLGKYIDQEYVASDVANSIITSKLEDFLLFNYNLSIDKSKFLLHIILYNYIYSFIYEDEFLKKMGFEEIVENSSSNTILRLIEDRELLFSLITNYIDIITNPEIEIIITDNFNVCNSIKTFDDWGVSFSENTLLVTDILKNVLFELNNWCTFSGTEFRDDIIFNFLTSDIDAFDIAKEEFGNVEVFLFYKKLLIQELYITSALFLTVEKNKRRLSLEETTLLTFVELSITNNEINTLPKSKVKILQMVQCFYNYNFSKKEYINSFPLETEKTVKLARKKINSLVLYGVLN